MKPIIVVISAIVAIFVFQRSAVGQYGNPQRGIFQAPGNYSVSVVPQYTPESRLVGRQPTVNSVYGRSLGGPPAATTSIPANDLSRFDFRSPSLDLLKRLGAQKPALAGDQPYQQYPRIPGEFEPQAAMLLSISDLMPQHHHVLKSLIAKTAGHLPIVILVNDKKQLKTAVQLAESTGQDLSHVRFIIFKLDTIWLRDFGPRFVETKDGARSIDFYYDGTRPQDDQFPNRWGEIAGIKNTTVQWTLQGGNMISNGLGLAITTTRFFEDNYVRFSNANKPANVEYERRKLVVDAFKKECNVERMVFLRPLTPEATKHVDMFTTFLAPDHLLVARLDPRLDAANARTLDENAALLRSVMVDGNPLRVDRISIPPRQGKYWSPYTNVIFANDLVLMPVYKNDPPQYVSQAIQTYRRLLPGKHVDTIDMTSMQQLEGALHCMSINVPKFAQLPGDLMSAAQAQQVVSGQRQWKSPPRLVVNRDVRPKLNGQVNRKPTTTAPVKPQELLTGQIVIDRPDQRTGSSQKSQPSAPAVQSRAAESYRRSFSGFDRSFVVDGYAVGYSQQRVRILRASDQAIVVVHLSRLQRSDQQWVLQNQNIIQSNGPRVKSMVIQATR